MASWAAGSSACSDPLIVAIVKLQYTKQSLSTLIAAGEGDASRRARRFVEQSAGFFVGLKRLPFNDT